MAENEKTWLERQIERRMGKAEQIRKEAAAIRRKEKLTSDSIERAKKEGEKER